MTLEETIEWCNTYWARVDWEGDRVKVSVTIYEIKEKEFPVTGLNSTMPTLQEAIADIELQYTEWKETGKLRRRVKIK